MLAAVSPRFSSAQLGDGVHRIPCPPCPVVGDIFDKTIVARSKSQHQLQKQQNIEQESGKIFNNDQPQNIAGEPISARRQQVKGVGSLLQVRKSHDSAIQMPIAGTTPPYMSYLSLQDNNLDSENMVSGPPSSHNTANPSMLTMRKRQASAASLMAEYQRGQSTSNMYESRATSPAWFSSSKMPTFGQSFPSHTERVDSPLQSPSVQDPKYAAAWAASQAIYPSMQDVVEQQSRTKVAKSYKVLEIVEKRCMALIRWHMMAMAKDQKPAVEQWRTLTANHHALVDRHYDLIHATQQPDAPEDVKSFITERQLPARLWTHGIHALLELQRQNLPESLEFMESFVHHAYQMTALLYETVQVYRDIWIECLGDLARFRTAIESTSITVQENWCSVARHWYLKASGDQPSVGRLYHHLGILTKNNPIRQLALYCKALCCTQPFSGARQSMQDVFDGTKTSDSKAPIIDSAILFYGALFNQASIETVNSTRMNFMTTLSSEPNDTVAFIKRYGIYLVIATLTAFLGYGTTAKSTTLVDDSSDGKTSDIHFPSMSDSYRSIAGEVLVALTTVVLSSSMPEEIVWPWMHVLLVAMLRLYATNHSIQTDNTFNNMAWQAFAEFLTRTIQEQANQGKDILRFGFKQTKDIYHSSTDIIPLAEDYIMRGLIWCDQYFPQKFFDEYAVDEGHDCMDHESESIQASRKQRVLWLALELTQVVSEHKSMLGF